MLVLFCDTDSDVTPEVAKKYGYNLISMPYAIDGVTTYPYVDFDVFDAHAFYDKLRAGALPNTSAISVESYIEYFEPHFAAGNDILYVHFSRAMTATFDNMDIAVKELLEKYPDRKFYGIDTYGITLLCYELVCEVGKRITSGMPVEEVVTWAENEKFKFAVYFFADDLKFFAHSGRVSGLAGTMGTLLGIRPIIHIGDDGKMTSIGKEKGRAKAIDRLVSIVEELGDDIGNYTISVGHTDAPELAKELSEKIKERLGKDLNIEIVDANPTIGSHCGPNTVGVAFHAKHR